jgi:hypothetical protein
VLPKNKKEINLNLKLTSEVKSNSKLVICLNENKPTKICGALDYTCNPRHSGGRDQEDCGLKPTQANSLPVSKNPSQINRTLRGIGAFLVKWLL